MKTNQLPTLPTPKFTETIRGVPCITVTEHEHLMRVYALQAIAQDTQAESDHARLPGALKDHQIAAMVNSLRDIARQFHGHDSLRERIANMLVPALKAEAKTGVPFGYIHHYVAHDDSGVIIDTTWEADGCADAMPHPTHPAAWKWSHATPFYTIPQPAQATQAEVTDGIRPEDFTVDVVVKPMGGFAPVNTHGVRVTHKPTGISVTCDAARSQHENRHQAFEKLSAILSLRPERVPMTDDERCEAYLKHTKSYEGYRSTFMRGVWAAEIHHGIKPKE